MGGITGSGVTAASVTSALATNDRVTGPPGGVVPIGVPGVASEYFLDEVSDSNPGLSSGFRLDCFWSQDGLKIWTARQADTIRQYDVSPAWGINSGDWAADFTTGAIANLRSIWWSPDGTVFSECIRVPSTLVRITTFDQSATPFDITVLGASTTKAWSPTGGITPQDHIWSDDGLRLWIHGPIGGTSPLLEFTVTSPFDASTIVSIQVKSFDMVPDAGTDVRTVAFSNDGKILYIIDGSVLSSWDLGTAFDIDTTSNFTAGPSVPSANVAIPKGLTFRNDNADIFTAGDQNQRRAAWFRKSIAPKISDYLFNAEADLSGGNRVSLNGVMVTDDGLHLYCCRSSAVVEDVFWFEMSVAHDLSSIAFTEENNADGQPPRGVFVRQDGSQLFISYRNPTNTDAIFRWPLSTAFDIDTKGSRTTLVTEPPGSNSPSGMHFRPDGTKVYITDTTANEVLEFTLGTPWDLTTGSHTGTFDTSGEVTTISDVTMSEDGSKMYVLDRFNEEVEQYNLTVLFDIDSAVASGITPLALEQGTGLDPVGISLVNNNAQLYVVYDDNRIVEQYTM